MDEIQPAVKNDATPNGLNLCLYEQGGHVHMATPTPFDVLFPMPIVSCSIHLMIQRIEWYMISALDLLSNTMVLGIHEQQKEAEDDGGKSPWLPVSILRPALCPAFETNDEWLAPTQAQGAKDASWNVCSTCLAPPERDTRLGNGISSTTKTLGASSPVAGGVMD
ncbi:hypothetical protein OPV22_033579 [Ensete ventricosum]|uniref:Uncharacterized protein n=1 Tax=Ensete ventricosum TaxID=4639 RepID=A0AAV8Q1S3_ENSVE|nr:hypothetical protein OPV22_033579 [Ensete ventricosum]